MEGGEEEVKMAADKNVSKVGKPIITSTQEIKLGSWERLVHWVPNAPGIGNLFSRFYFSRRVFAPFSPCHCHVLVHKRRRIVTIFLFELLAFGGKKYPTWVWSELIFWIFQSGLSSLKFEPFTNSERSDICYYVLNWWGIFT